MAEKKYVIDNPELMREWDWEKNDALGLDPMKLTQGSNQKAHWKCKLGHKWEARIDDRTGKHTGCPVCARDTQTSFPEQAIFYYLNKVVDAKNRYILFGREIDIYLPSLNIGIEYNGDYYHKNKRKADSAKIEMLSDHGIRIITISEAGYDSVDEDHISYVYQRGGNKHLDWMITQIFLRIPLQSIKIDSRIDENEIYAQYVNGDNNRSVAKLFPHLISEWNKERNGGTTPDAIPYGSNKSFWWRCSKCGHEWKALVFNRTIGSQGCPRCYETVSRRKPLYCVELNCIYGGSKIVRSLLNISPVSCCRGTRKSAGKHPETGEPLHWYYVYDQPQKDGTIIKGAISLGLITEEWVNEQLTKQN